MSKRTWSATVTEELESVGQEPLVWRKIAEEGLDVDYTRLLPRSLADSLFRVLEDELEYYSADMTRVFVYGKWHFIPRQQVAYGDPGMNYKFSGTSVPARPWPQVLLVLKDVLTRITGICYNFVLVNRYRDGKDCMGEHRDDEKDLVATAPIASLSLGQARLFVLRHADARKKGAEKRNVPPVKLELEHGSLLMMNPPTNKFWYHALPPRKRCPGVRLNLTFRQLHEKPPRDHQNMYSGEILTSKFWASGSASGSKK